MYLGKYHISLRCIQIVQIIFLYFNSLGLYSSDIYFYMSPLRFFCQSDEFISSWPLLCEDCGVPFAYFMNIKWHIRCRAFLIHGPQMRKMKENRNTNEYICRTHKKCDTQKKGTIQMFRPHTSCTKVNLIFGVVTTSGSVSTFYLIIFWTVLTFLLKKRRQSENLNRTQFVPKIPPPYICTFRFLFILFFVLILYI